MKMLLPLLALVAAVGADAAPFAFTVANDHTNLIYACGEEATFAVTVCETNGEKSVRGTLAVTLDNFGPKVQHSRTVDLAKENPFVVRGSLAEPGFLRLVVRAKGAADFVWSVGYEPEKLRKGSPSPDDFDAFWASARAKLAKEVPLDAKMARLPERSTADFDYYLISFATFGRRVYGYMSRPTNKAKAPYPVEVQVAAAGFGDWTNRMSGDPAVLRVFFAVYPWAPHQDWRTLGLKSAYDNMNELCGFRYGCKRYCTAGIAKSREDYFYYPVLLGIDRAVDWLAEQPDVDKTRFWYQGTSQGGGFGFYLTGLNRRFTRACFYVPAITDTMGYLKHRQSGWPQIVESQKPENRACAAKFAPYFDGANFASRIRCPVRVVVGFADTTCPPCAVYASYNEIPVADKGILHGFGMGHGCLYRFYEELGSWLRK